MEPQDQTQPPQIQPKKSKLNWKKVLLILGIVIFVAAIVGGLAWYFASQGTDDSNIAKKESTKTEKAEVKKEQVKKIYYSDNTKLYSVNPSDKKITEIDTAVTSNGGAVGYGSQSPLMAPDFLKVAYIKNNEVWVKEDLSNPKKIEQPTPKKTAGFYSWYISGWSSDSSKFTYSINFDCGMGSADCDETDEDKNATGIYWYSLNSGKSTKLSIPRTDMWLPNSQKVVYFSKVNNLSYLHTYDVLSKEDKVITATPFEGLEPQIAFSDDATKMIYSYGPPSGGVSRIVIANADNTNQKIQKEGKWAEYQWPRFVKGSTSDYVYSHSEEWACPGGTGGCPKMILYSVVAGATKNLGGIINHITGFWDATTIIVLRGYNYDAAKTRTLSLVNVSDSSSVVNLYEGKEQLESKLGWQ